MCAEKKYLFIIGKYPSSQVDINEMIFRNLLPWLHVTFYRAFLGRIWSIEEFKVLNFLVIISLVLGLNLTFR